jgi:hypothetical protein
MSAIETYHHHTLAAYSTVRPWSRRRVLAEEFTNFMLENFSLNAISGAPVLGDGRPGFLAGCLHFGVDVCPTP